MSDSSRLDVLVPNLPESVSDATIAVWHKKEGDFVQLSEVLLEIETDKIMLEVPSPCTGILGKILEPEGSVVISGQILGCLKIDNHVNIGGVDNIIHSQEDEQNHLKNEIVVSPIHQAQDSSSQTILISPSIRKLISEHDLTSENIKGTGIKGRITKKDIEMHLQQQSSETHYPIKLDSKQPTNDLVKKDHYTKSYDIQNNIITDVNNRTDRRVKMSRLRKTIAERLLNVTNSTAMLTTFNEVNMKPVMVLRNQYQDLFEQRYHIKLGFLSFYVKAVLEGLRKFPEINASMDGEEIIYHNYFDISIAVSTERGLVTPVLRNVNSLNIADIETNIKSLAKKGRDGKLTLEELKGGSFTITNGGIFGSLISTPIINPPQSAILGMHVIKDRPIALNGEIVILPMMYLALSYDHRLIDGKDSVNFLMTVKELIEDPIRLLLDI